MANICFPEKLQNLLNKDHGLNGWITTFAQKVGEILRGNDLTFFPGFTDHGIDHIESVLKTEVELVPNDVWDTGILKSQDAAIIIGGTLLHDLAMHLHEKGFQELIKPGSRWKPLPWFNQAHEGHSADLSWSDLWEQYEREARKFSDSVLGNIIGPQVDQEKWVFKGLPKDKGQWDLNTRLVVGEFIRRHHPRLAHEVAMYGFPGLKDEEFPVLAKDREELADLVGLVARSHGMDLRVCMSYLEQAPIYSGTTDPLGTAIYYPMALLRVADYLQIDSQRAPAVLLQLKDPQSLVSIREWQTHKAVLSITQAKDPAGKKVTVSKKVSLDVFLQLRDLMIGLQREMDHSTAVLDEVYGRCEQEGFSILKLKYRRVHSNVSDPSFQKALPYVPDRTGFSADPNLLPLLVAPLYGAYPGVGVRELMQNAVDAVRELEVWLKSHRKKSSELDLPKLPEKAAVLIDFSQNNDGSWVLKIQDRGIGMTASMLQKYFLRAGASFRQSPEWVRQFTDNDGKPRVLRSGRFGIGAFAVFLLGSEFKLTTRHAGEATGHEIESKMDSRLIAIRPVAKAKVGTVIEVPLRDEAAIAFGLHEERMSDRHLATDWFCQKVPKVVRRVVRPVGTTVLQPAFERDMAKDSGWMTIQPKGYHAVHWTPSFYPALSCNGIRIAAPADGAHRDVVIEWPFSQLLLKKPNIAVDDSANCLPLTTQRYDLLTRRLPFLNEIARDVILSFIAHTLVCGPQNRVEALSLTNEINAFPLCGEPNRKQRFRGEEELYLDRWFTTQEAFVPFDPWLLKLLQVETLLICGCERRNYWEEKVLDDIGHGIARTLSAAKCVVLKWDGSLREGARYRDFTRFISARYPSLLERGYVEHDLDWVSSETARAVGYLPEAFEVVVTGRNDKRSRLSRESLFEYAGGRKREGNRWERQDGASEKVNIFKMREGEFKAPIDLDSMSQALLGVIDEHSRSKRGYDGFDDVAFLAALPLAKDVGDPEFLIAKIWQEVLGQYSIPFDIKARQALIAQAKMHPDIKRHIEAWEDAKKRA